MKTFFKVLGIALALVIVGSGDLSAKKKKTKAFKGHVTYEISYVGDMEPSELAKLPKEQVVDVYGNTIKTESDMQGQVFFTNLVYGNDSTMVQVIDAGPQFKKYIEIKPENFEAMEFEVPEFKSIEDTEETKEIAGYTCSKMIYTRINDYDEEEKIEVWYCPEITNGSPFFNEFPQLKGFPMEYTVKGETMTVTYKVKTVEADKKLKETAFMLPADAEALTEEELQQLREANEQQ